MAKRLLLLTSLVSAQNFLVGGDAIPPTAVCSIRSKRMENDIPCISAQYPDHLKRPQSINEAELKIHFEGDVLGCGCDVSIVPECNQENEVLVLRRGQCSFAVKAKMAFTKGYTGLILVNNEGSEDCMVPNLQGLDVSSAPSVVLITDKTFQLMETETKVSIKWNEWVPTDTTSMYYDGIRLGKEGKYSEAADMHLKAVNELPEFKSPGYEHVNNLLRAGAPSIELVNAIKQLKVLPIDKEEDFVNLRRCFADMVDRAYDRVFRQRWWPRESLRLFLHALSSAYHQPTIVVSKIKSIFSLKEQHHTDVVVICVATDETPELSSLRSSVQSCGYELVVLGVGAKYGSSGGTKLHLMEEWLVSPTGFASMNKSDDTLLLFVDAYDVLLMPSAKYLGKVFNKFNTSMIISGETGCWPDPGVAPIYPWPHYQQQPQFGSLYPSELVHDTNIKHAPFPYPNSGGYVGKAGYMRSMIVEVMDDVRSGHLIGGGTIGDADDQRWLQRHWLRHPDEVAIDVLAEIFLSLHQLQLPLALGNSYDSLHHPLNISTEGHPPLSEIRPIVSTSQSHHVGAWMKIGETPVTPLVLHGNGHGKRLFRVISCKLSLHCTWNGTNNNPQGSGYVPMEETPPDL